MSIQDEWVRCDPSDPNRCQASGQNGQQCPYKARPNYKFCIRHASSSDSTAAVKAARMYKLQQYQERVEQFTSNDEIKNLRVEIGILRMILEKIITECHGEDVHLIAHAGKISDIVIKVRTLVATCQKIEIQTGSMLDRDKAMLIGQKIVEIVSDVVPDQQILDRLGDRIIGAIYEISNTNG